MLSDVVESAGLEGFAEIGLVMFVIAFVLITLRVVLLSSEEADRHAELPFDDETSAGGEQ
jgi:hypothetical protein